MFQAAWPKISQRGGVEDESDRKKIVVEEKLRVRVRWEMRQKGTYKRKRR